MTNIAVFASGSGSNFEAIAEACRSGAIGARIALLVCDNPNAPVIERARRRSIPTFVFEPASYTGKASYETKIASLLEADNVELICLAGYMRIVGKTLLAKYEGRIMNIHPSLLPAFKGANAIDDAFRFGVKVFGVTIHWIDSTLDGGVIIAQRAFEYCGGDRNELEARIHAVEHELYVETIHKILSDAKNKSN